jgi:hypothetical protein
VAILLVTQPVGHTAILLAAIRPLLDFLGRHDESDGQIRLRVGDDHP